MLGRGPVPMGSPDKPTVIRLSLSDVQKVFSSSIDQTRGWRTTPRLIGEYKPGYLEGVPRVEIVDWGFVRKLIKD